MGMEKETLLREDVIEILGPRPFEDNMTFEAQTKHSKSEDFKLPPGLRHWEKSFRYKDSSSDSGSGSSSASTEAASTSGMDELPQGWRRAHTIESGEDFENQSIEQTSTRHPGKPLPSGWKTEVDEEGRTEFVHVKTGFRSWSLEDDPALSEELKKEIEESTSKKDERFNIKKLKTTIK